MAGAEKKNNIDTFLKEWERGIYGDENAGGGGGANSPPIGAPPPYADKSHLPPTSQRGLVLVWDLDGTLVTDSLFRKWHDGHNKPLYENKRPDTITIRPQNLTQMARDYINQAAVQVIRLAQRKKREDPGKVDAVVLLTNNGDPTYIKSIADSIHGMIGEEPFDLIWDNNNGKRVLQERFVTGGRRQVVARKAMEDVRAMLQELKRSTDDLEHRVYFFDDQEYHTLAEELIAAYAPNPGTFVKIDPAFTGNKFDYSEVFWHIMDVLNDSTDLTKAAKAKANANANAKANANANAAATLRNMKHNTAKVAPMPTESGKKRNSSWLEGGMFRIRKNRRSTRKSVRRKHKTLRKRR